MSKFPAEKRGRGYQQNAKEKKEAHDANAMRYPIWQASLFAIITFLRRKRTSVALLQSEKLPPQFKTCVRISSESFSFVIVDALVSRTPLRPMQASKATSIIAGYNAAACPVPIRDRPPELIERMAWSSAKHPRMLNGRSPRV
jgi:hypothetical protein